jgi:anti-sigma-K factor RskA
MSKRNADVGSRAEELLLDQAISGLSEAEQNELNSLLEQALNDKDAADLQDEFMQTAALIQLGMASIESQKQEKLPAHVRERILASAPRAKDKNSNAGNDEKNAPKVTGSGSNVVPISATLARKSAPGQSTVWRNPALGWAVAAMLAIALVTFRTDFSAVDNIAQERSDLMASAGDLLKTPWSTSEFANYRQVTGDVVWSDGAQEGYMRLANMPSNNPTLKQYQLWIVDPERSAQPVDGGVFDVPAGASEIIVPINAKLNVSRPTAFAITLEKPGGVVVSAGPLLVVAAVANAG